MKIPNSNKFIAEQSTSGPVPKHYRIREFLRQQIRNMESGEPIPTETKLCELFGVSRTTVRKAIERLSYEGLVYRVQGKGTFVAPPKMREHFVQSGAGLYDDALARGISLITKVLEQAIIVANKQIAEYLNLVQGDSIFKLVRLRFIDHKPVLISHSYVPEQLCPGIVHEDFESQSLYALMKQKYGIEIHHGLRVVEAMPCEEDEAYLLQVPPGLPLLVVTGTMFDENGTVAEYGLAKFRGDRSQIEIEVVPEGD